MNPVVHASCPVLSRPIAAGSTPARVSGCVLWLCHIGDVVCIALSRPPAACPSDCRCLPADVGIGMICPIQVTYSLMVGAILSYGIMWPLLARKQGSDPDVLGPNDWYLGGTKYSEGGSRIEGLSGYKTFVAGQH